MSLTNLDYSKNNHNNQNILNNKNQDNTIKKFKKPLKEYIKSNSSNILIESPLDEHYDLSNDLGKIREIEEIGESELEKLEKEFVIKSKSNLLVHPKNYGNTWTDKEREKILKYLKKNSFENYSVLFDESVIFDIAHKLERTEYAVKEEIKKMIFNEFMNGSSNLIISKRFNIPEPNIKLLLKIFIEKNGKKTINSMEIENQLLKLKIENIKLKKELREITD